MYNCPKGEGVRNIGISLYTITLYAVTRTLDSMTHTKRTNESNLQSTYTTDEDCYKAIETSCFFIMPFYGTNVKSLESNKIGEEEESKKLY